MSSLELFLLTVITSLAGAWSTYFLKQKMNSVRAYSLASLIFVAIALLTQNPILLALQPAFFGSTFVAMSEPHRLSKAKVMIAGGVFGVILFTLQKIDFTHFHGGIGGTLGGAAFVACLIVYGLEALLPF